MLEKEFLSYVRKRMYKKLCYKKRQFSYIKWLQLYNAMLFRRIYELEKKMKTPFKFQYPCFETINWFAAKRLLKELKDLNSEAKKCPNYFLLGVKALLSILKQWNTDKDVRFLIETCTLYWLSVSFGTRNSKVNPKKN